MSVKTFTFRYDPDSDIGKWMASQAKKNVSLELAIQTLIGNFGYEDLCEVIPRQVPLEVNKVKPRKKRVSKPKKANTQKSPNKVKKQPQDDEIAKSEIENNDDDNTTLDMFSSL